MTACIEFMVEAILFDIDGTLVDSTPAVERTWRAWARSRGFDAEKILASSHGRRTEDTLADFLPAHQIPQAARELLDLETADLEGVVALPGARELLTALPPRQWAAVTSGGCELMRRRLDVAGLPVPEVLISAEDVQAGKPDPEGYHLAAARLGANPHRCLVLEDAPAGVEAGRRAGGQVLAVATSHTPAQLAGRAQVIQDLRQLQVSSGATVFRGHDDAPAPELHIRCHTLG